jgi:hypothetical protein
VKEGQKCTAADVRLSDDKDAECKGFSPLYEYSAVSRLNYTMDGTGTSRIDHDEDRSLAVLSVRGNDEHRDNIHFCKVTSSRKPNAESLTLRLLLVGEINRKIIKVLRLDPLWSWQGGCCVICIVEVTSTWLPSPNRGTLLQTKRYLFNFYQKQSCESVHKGSPKYFIYTCSR